MGEEACKKCRSWEEEIYWTHFRCINFSQFLHAGFDQCLDIPEKFTRKLKKKLPEVVSLKGPSGYSWKVQLTTNDNIFFFNHGWREFVKDHSLEENDFLVFKYNGDSHFDVLMFDGQSMCEKAASYFVKKSENRGNESGFQKERTADGSVEVTIASVEDAGGSKTNIPTNYAVKSIPLRNSMTSQVTNKRIWREVKLSKSIIASPSVQNEKLPPWAEEKEAKPDITPRFRGHKVVHRAADASRIVTEEDKENALQLAQAALSNDGFIIVIRPTHLSKHYATIPTAWVSSMKLSPGSQDVILRFKEKTWHTRLVFLNNFKRGALSKGWKKFSVDNNLHEHDVCVFEPRCLVKNSVILDVVFFRATTSVSAAIPGPQSLQD